ncbi:hypothetical protein BJ138DRAFT_1152060, partial [Hygrophoropsis aurantiaca]
MFASRIFALVAFAIVVAAGCDQAGIDPISTLYLLTLYPFRLLKDIALRTAPPPAGRAPLSNIILVAYPGLVDAGSHRLRLFLANPG